MKLLDQIKSIKFDWSKLKGTSDERGFVYLKDKTLQFNKQRHFALALFLALFFFTFFEGTKFTNFSDSIFRNDLFNLLVTSIIVWLIGFLIEFLQRLNPKRNFDLYDAHTMLIAALNMCSFLVIWRVIRFYVL